METYFYGIEWKNRIDNEIVYLEDEMDNWNFRGWKGNHPKLRV